MAHRTRIRNRTSSLRHGARKPMAAALTLFFLMMLFSCRNALLPGGGDAAPGSSSAKGTLCHVTGSLSSAQGAVPQSRTATAQFSLSQPLFYTLTARPSDEPDADGVQGEVQADTLSYAIDLSDGTWQLEVHAWGAWDGSSYSEEKLSGRTQIRIENGALTQGDVTIRLGGITSEGGSGAVSLSVAVEDGSGITQADVSWTARNGTSSGSQTVSFASSTSQTLSMTLPSGTYDALFAFRNQAGAVLYSFVETLNVYQNMTTDSWADSSASPYLSGGGIRVSESLVEQYATTVFYVSPDGTDGADGSWFSPFPTLRKAVETVESVNNGSSAYTIFLLGDMEAGSEDMAVCPDGNAMAYIQSSRPLNLTITSHGGAEYALDAGHGGHVLYVGQNVSLALRNVTLRNGAATDGGGIYAAQGAAVEMGDDVLVSGNRATGNGGGVYNAGTMFMYGSAVIGDGSKNETANSSAYSNKAEKGGGIYNTGSLYAGYTAYTDEANNTPQDFTGGIYYNYATSTTDDSGGGICNSGAVIMQGGTVAYNGTSGGGGGIYTAGSLSATRLTIQKNESAKSGGGMFTRGTEIARLTDCTVQENKSLNSGWYGGGVFASGTGGLTLTDTIFDGNTASTASGQLAVWSNCTVTLIGSTRFSGTVYLNGGNTNGLTIGGALTATSTPIATISLDTCTSGRQVLSLAPGADTTIADECGKFAVKESGWAIDSAGKLQDTITLSASESADITNPSVPYIITGATGQNNSQIDINNGVTASGDSTYYITLDNVTRTAGEWASGMLIYNENAGTTLTVCITLVGENSIVAGKNHGGLQVKAVSGATVNVIFRTATGGSLFLDSLAKTDIAKESGGTVAFSVESGSYFSGTSGGNSCTDADAFFTAAQSSTGGSTIRLSDTPMYSVTFNANSGTAVPSQSVRSGSTAEAPSAPTKDGYTFDGWTTSPDDAKSGDGTAYDFSAAVTADITLYARWKKAINLVKGLMGATSQAASVSVYYGGTYRLLYDSGVIPTITGNWATFKGWCTEEDGQGTKITETMTVGDDAPSDVYGNWELSYSTGEIGDIVLQTGKYVTAANYKEGRNDYNAQNGGTQATSGADFSSTAVGVVCASGYMVHLSEISTSKTVYYDTASVYYSIAKDNATKAKASGFESGWTLPNEATMVYILSNRATINASLNAANSTSGKDYIIEQFYWISSPTSFYYYVTANDGKRSGSGTTKCQYLAVHALP